MTGLSEAILLPIIILVLLIVVMGIALYKEKKRLLRSSNRRDYRNRIHNSSSQTSTQIQWNDIPINHYSNSSDPPTNTSFENSQIGWIDIEVNNSPVFIDIPTPSVTQNHENEPVPDPNFFDPTVPDDLNNILESIIGCTDPNTLAIFSPGERVYLCRRCRSAYHEDSWQDSNRECQNCDTDQYIIISELPLNINSN
ncbi:hypothetical protein [Planktothrix agardhii]|uniref:hypothetical protein n=1 Tax=Planktothrix agardhii TaxID=1160 RepID=UPI00040C54B7|nr:hypothetical protein [Planktothrix agardhii]